MSTIDAVRTVSDVSCEPGSLYWGGGFVLPFQRAAGANRLPISINHGFGTPQLDGESSRFNASVTDAARNLFDPFVRRAPELVSDHSVNPRIPQVAHYNESH